MSSQKPLNVSFPVSVLEDQQWWLLFSHVHRNWIKGNSTTAHGAWMLRHSFRCWYQHLVQSLLPTMAILLSGTMTVRISCMSELKCRALCKEKGRVGVCVNSQIERRRAAKWQTSLHDSFLNMTKSFSADSKKIYLFRVLLCHLSTKSVRQ